MGLLTENEIKVETYLCENDGKLNNNAIGWARKPLFISNIPSSDRTKKWNYWCVMSEKCLFSATISEKNGDLVCFIYYIDYITKSYVEKTWVIQNSTEVKMTSNVEESLEIANNELKISFKYENEAVLIDLESDDFEGHRLQAKLKIHYKADMESLNVVIPWSEHLFQYTSKQLGLPAEGELYIDNQQYTFNSMKNFAVLDFGRGIWPRETIWNWGMASGVHDGKVIGINFGGKWTDGTGMCENGVLIDNRIYKIQEDVDFHYNTANFMDEWEIKSTYSNNVELKFKPFFERFKTSEGNADIRYKTEVHQMVGYYSGKILVDGDREIILQDLLGTIEEHIALW